MSLGADDGALDGTLEGALEGDKLGTLDGDMLQRKYKLGHDADLVAFFLRCLDPPPGAVHLAWEACIDKDGNVLAT